MTLLIAADGWDAEAWRDRFRAQLPGMAVVGVRDAFDRGQVRYVARWRQPPGVLRDLPNLRTVFSLGAGVDHILSDPDLPPHVPVVRLVDDDLRERMSEYVVMHCLMHLRQQHRYEAQRRTRAWDDDRMQPAAREIRVGIMGLGVLGLDAARKLQIMGFDVAGWSRGAKNLPDMKAFSGEAGLGPFLARTDILVTLVPLTPQTRGIIDRRLLGGLARDGRLGGPVLVNPGRGGLQVEKDILAMLDDGSLKAASLDVFETEPLPETSPFWSHPAVFVTPHNAAMSEPEAVARYVARQIEAIEAGRTPEGLVDRASGY